MQMFQKLLRALLVLGFMGLLPVGCVDVCPNLPDYATLREFSFSLAESTSGAPSFSDPELASGARTTVPTLLAHIKHLDYDYVATAPTGSPFSSPAVAWSCVEDYGSKGLRDRVAAVTLTSTGLFNGLAAGQPLNQFVRCRSYQNYADSVAFPLAQLPNLLNAWKNDELRTPLTLRISPKPRDNARQQFSLRVRLESGKEIVQTTPEIFWE